MPLKPPANHAKDGHIVNINNAVNDNNIANKNALSSSSPQHLHIVIIIAPINGDDNDNNVNVKRSENREGDKAPEERGGKRLEAPKKPPTTQSLTRTIMALCHHYHAYMPQSHRRLIVMIVRALSLMTTERKRRRKQDKNKRLKTTTTNEREKQRKRKTKEKNDNRRTSA